MFTGAPDKILLDSWHWGLAAVSLVVALAEEKLDWFERLMQAPAGLTPRFYPRYGSASRFSRG